MSKKILTIIFTLFIFFCINVNAEDNSERYEAEEAEIFQCNNAGTHIAQMDLAGSYVNLELYDTTAPGVYNLKVFYCADIEGTNTHTIFVNEENAGQLTYPKTNTGWGTFSEDVFVETEITLKSGSNYIRFEKTDNDSGFAELDAIMLTPVSLFTPDPASITPTPKPTEVKTAAVTISPTTVKIQVPDNNSSFNYLYIILPVVILLIIGTVIWSLKKKAK